MRNSMLPSQNHIWTSTDLYTLTVHSFSTNISADENYMTFDHLFFMLRFWFLMFQKFVNEYGKYLNMSWNSTYTTNKNDLIHSFKNNSCMKRNKKSLCGEAWCKSPNTNDTLIKSWVLLRSKIHEEDSTICEIQPTSHFKILTSF